MRERRRYRQRSHRPYSKVRGAASLACIAALLMVRGSWRLQGIPASRRQEHNRHRLFRPLVSAIHHRAVLESTA